MPSTLSFEVHARDGAARTGVVSTSRGDIRTPAFMPVGTAATVKAMHPEHVKDTGADILLSNTYHLMLRPSAERIAELGGLHGFMQWNGPILTDSGGFQVMSLAQISKITEDGVTFQSHIDGSRHMLSPERSMEIQSLLDSDIHMAFDECTPYPATHEEAERSMRLSMRWAARSREAFMGRAAPRHALFGIVQGGVYTDLREASLEALLKIGFEGYAIGGLAVGEGREVMFSVLDGIAGKLPTDKPRYLMGVGKPQDLIGAVRRGVDMFDCVLPTRSGRHGQAFTWDGPVNIKNARFADDPAPLDAQSTCPASKNYSRAYLNHLFKAGEYLGPMLLTWHNVNFYQSLMARIRAAIGESRLDAFAEAFLQRYGDAAPAPADEAGSNALKPKKK